MTIEPLGSMMSLQAQSTPVAKPVAEKNANVPEVAAQPAQAIDKTTAIVENVQSKGQENSGEQGKDQQASTEQIRKAVEQLNKKMEHSEAVFGIHEDTNRVTIKLVDKDTKEVIKELPPEKTLDMIAKVWEMAGILVDEKR